MRTHTLFIALSVALSACGTWSNQDLEYLYAFPRKETIKSQLEASANAQKQALNAGDVSDAYDKLKKGSDEFNAFIDGVLEGLDNIRKVPPTRRTETSRTWGPYDDPKHPGFQVQVDIERTDELSFKWLLKIRRRGSEFFIFGQGEFKATERLTQGRGSMSFDAKTARENLMEAGKPNDPDRATLKYVTETVPVKVSIDFEFPNAVTGAYAFNGYSDHSAVLQWNVTNLPDLNATKITFVAGWTSTTAGVADFVILEGKWAPGTGRQCWDEQHRVMYAKGYDDAGPFEVGDKTRCVTVPTLQMP